uniref:Uncharacterized protein n=2 Tax=Aegilops tauschii subsp. strangulata TaxID=200361 RepID=A0A453APR9_AEGTS
FRTVAATQVSSSREGNGRAERAMSLVAACAAGARASLLSSSAISSSRPCPALARHSRAYRPLVSPAASRGGRPSTRLRVRAARLESTGVSVGFRAPQFELPEPLTGKIWTLDDFEGSPALLGYVHMQSLSICKTSEKRYCKAHFILYGERTCFCRHILKFNCDTSPGYALLTTNKHE